MPGTADDALRLQAGSPAFNYGSAGYLPADFADLDGDGNKAEPVPLDLDGRARVIDGALDAGDSCLEF